jgi:hypothetical protein
MEASPAYKGLFSSFDKQIRDSQAWRARFKDAPARVCNGGSGGGSGGGGGTAASSGGGGGTSLCASAGGQAGGAGLEAYASLLMATSPLRYSALRPADTGGTAPLAPARDQGDCSTCTAHAVVAAAEVRAARTALPPPPGLWGRGAARQPTSWSRDTLYTC